MTEPDEKPVSQSHGETVRTLVACVSMTAQILVLLRVFDLI